MWEMWTNPQTYAFLVDMDFWGWMTLAFILIGIELITANMITLWFGIAASFVAIVKLFAPLPVGGDWGVFLFLSAILLWCAKKFFGYKAPVFESAHAQKNIEYVGQLIQLTLPIENNSGRILLDGVWWRVQGPDCEVGTTIRILAIEDGALRVEPFEAKAMRL